MHIAIDRHRPIPLLFKGNGKGIGGRKEKERGRRELGRKGSGKERSGGRKKKGRVEWGKAGRLRKEEEEDKRRGEGKEGQVDDPGPAF